MKKIEMIKRKLQNRAIAIALFCLLGAGSLWGCSDVSDVSTADAGNLAGTDGLGGSIDIEEETATVSGTLQVHFIDVGQGDCTLISSDGHYMLIDAGDNNKGTAVQLYLSKQGVTTLDYVIGTHPDSDHIGGLDVILTKFDCGTVFLEDSDKDTKTYQEVLDALTATSEQYVVPTLGDTYTLGEATFTIVGPVNQTNDGNNNSICILLTHGENTFLFCGDSEEAEEADMVASGMSLQADVYKVSHHGSKNGTTSDFYNVVAPAYAVISVGEGNSYGHPDAETLNILRSGSTKVFRTDEQGSIVITSDGVNLSFNCAPSETWQAGEGSEHGTEESVDSAAADGQIVAEAPSETPATGNYVLNTKTKKFHLPSCGHLPTSNREDSILSREELISQGYDPCGFCEP